MPRPTVRAVSLAALTALGSVALAARPLPDTQKIYVTVIDAKGKPVTGLKKEDFTVRLDQTPQEVLGLEPAVDPASVLILTDRLGLNPTYTPFDVGRALREFANTFRKANADTKLSLTTFDGTTVEVTKFTSPFADTDRALGRLSTNSDDAALFDGIANACKSMRSAPTDRKIIFTLLSAYRAERSALQPDHVGEMLRLSGASLWALEVRQVPGGNYNNPAREQVLDNGSVLSGGLHEVVSSISGVNASTKKFAELMLAQYVLTFGPGGGHRGTQQVVEVKRPGVRVLAPGWITR
jgi:hypothetical protein